jgi:hypothetical protein
MLRSITIFSLALIAVSLMIYVGVTGLPGSAISGPFFLFIGGCTAIGLALDIVNHVRKELRKGRIRKLGR